MADVLTKDQRRLNMSRIRGKDTKPEMALRRALHAQGLRYRLHEKSLPGAPDLVFPRYRAVLFVHGCFWHLHGCRYSKLPETRASFWARKLTSNSARDAAVYEMLGRTGWRTLVVWECAVRGPSRLPTVDLLREVTEFLLVSQQSIREISGARDDQKQMVPN